MRRTKAAHLASRLILGTRTSLIGVLANGLAVLFGAGVGVTAGYFGGWIGAVLMRFTDLMMAFRRCCWRSSSSRSSSRRS